MAWEAANQRVSAGLEIAFERLGTLGGGECGRAVYLPGAIGDCQIVGDRPALVTVNLILPAGASAWLNPMDLGRGA